jgi:hypothetical protein
MKYFFIEENGKKNGPFTIEELKIKRLSNKTLIWSDGFKNWKSAELVNELKDIVINEPPPLPKEEKSETENIIRYENQNINIAKLKESLKISILISIALCYLITEEALSQNSESGLFPIYLSAFEKENQFLLFLKFYPYSYIFVLIFVLIYKFIINKNFVKKSTSNYVLILLGRIDSNIGIVNKYSIEYITNHRGYIYQQLPSKKYFFKPESNKLYQELESCINNYHSYLIKEKINRR